MGIKSVGKKKKKGRIVAGDGLGNERIEEGIEGDGANGAVYKR